MPREAFTDELDALREDVVGMGDHVLGQLDDALRALETADADLARDVIDGDAAVNERYLDLEARCVDLFALQQPVASDLRFVAAAFKLLTDLERVGDLATNLGQYALAAETDGTPLLAADAEDVTDPDRSRVAGPSIAVPPHRVTEIGRDAQAMLAEALDAFESENADACVEIAQRDDELDVLCQRAGEDVVRQLIATGTDAATAEAAGSDPAPDDAWPDESSAPDESSVAESPAPDPQADEPPTEWDVEAALDGVSLVLLTIRDLERVGDHAVNVAARTYYMIEHDPTLIV